MGNLLDAGLLPTAIGIGIVFVVLGLLMGATHLLVRFGGRLKGPALPGPADRPADENAEVDREIAAVIAAAVQAYRRNRSTTGAF